ncbi:hypothetical protein [Aquisediminimonas profunda]|uniref:hypothetical protein n=1 Tax=Aquisediminimonas profunda TaxID=1550733 RepID=UPI001C635A47|nr:hypothetical protein [Aquisediminimonas profunda]
MPEERTHWWETRVYLAALVVLSIVPLLKPDVAPLTDLPAHMGHYRVELEIGSDAVLRQFYSFNWQLIGNLGVDLLVIPLSKLFGLELAVKIIICAIPALTAASFLLVAKEVHGRLPPTAALALPLAYGFPFQFGFVNFALSMAFGFLGFWLWLKMGNMHKQRLRGIVFVPLSMLIWVTHTYGWGALSLVAFASEFIRHLDKGYRWHQSLLRAGIACLPLVPPIFLMLGWRSGQVGGQTADMFNWSAKYQYFLVTLRDRWGSFDIGSLFLLLGVIVWALRKPRTAFSPVLGYSALFLLLAYLLMPRIVFGSAYADMRLTPFMLAIALIALRPPMDLDRRRVGLIALASFGFFFVRTTATTASFWLYDRDFDRQLAAIEHIPVHARLVSFVGQNLCAQPWAQSRMEHLPSLALVRKRAFANDQWQMPGAQLLRVRYSAGAPFNADPMQIVTPNKCQGEYWLRLDDALRRFPREAYDYVWLINAPNYDRALMKGYEPIWQDGSSVLYRKAGAVGAVHS